MTEHPEEAHHIVNVLKDANEALSIDEIVEETRYDRNVVRAIIYDLERDGQVEERYAPTQ